MVAGRTTQSGPLAQKPALIRDLETLQEKLEVEHAPTQRPLSVEMIVEDTTLITNCVIRKFVAVSYFLYSKSSTINVASYL